MKAYTLIILLIIPGILISSCADRDEISKKKIGQDTKIFELLSVDESGIDFNNKLKEDSVVNYFSYPYIYMGGGVAVGDVNNDGLQDLYFTGNMVENRLYLNKGNLKFEDISKQSGSSGDIRWMTGASMVDINADGLLDIYVSVSGKFNSTKNLMLVNQGVDDTGVPTFIDRAETMGIADEGRTTQATFFDYDNDGDLDLYNANYPATSFKTPNPVYSMMMYKKDPEKSDKLYRNNSDGSFTDVSEEAGVLNFGLALSATAGDFNQDGWTDLYISNDFATPDYFYFNNGDGTFTDKLQQVTQHTAFFGMGADAADFNNDGLLDLMQLDMTPEDNRRNKANMASMNPPGFWEMVSLGFHYQYMQNNFQLNNGITREGYPHFSDISRLTGTSSTDWSWSALFADLDNDGWKDLMITNGTRKDINNKDYFKKVDNATYQQKQKFDYLKLSKNIPNERVANYSFRNRQDLTFEDISDTWGLNYEGYTNGAAYADLDNDGDLEVIINNIDDPSIVYRNMGREYGLGNYLRIDLEGPKNNPLGLGTKVELFNLDDYQLFEHFLTRGFQSSVEPMVHFGVEKAERVEKIVVTWGDGKQQVLKNVSTNQLLKISYKNARSFDKESVLVQNYLFEDKTNDLGIDYLHFENPSNDFADEVLLPHMYSKNGPGLAVGDVDGDGLDDFYVGGAKGYSGVLFKQNSDGSFQRSDYYPGKQDALYEDMGALFFDADADRDLDLYVVSGGNENKKGSALLLDRLYLNDGSGKLTRSKEALPMITGSGSRVKAADFDDDGDLDLFVGGKVVPKRYPLPAKSYILRNDTDASVSFTDVTSEVAPYLEAVGLVTDAVWTDFNQDDLVDLVIVGEWLPITFLENNGGNFIDRTSDYGFEKSAGWWYSVTAEDFDKDGDEDIVAGNLGENYKYQASEEKSFDVYAKDFDGNGQLDIVLSYYQDGAKYPLRGRQCSSEQIPAISVRFPNYNSFAEATLEEVYSEADLEQAYHKKTWTFASSYIENQGGKNFKMKELPSQVQISSVNGIVTDDFNSDGHLDIFVAGNLYGSEVETPRNDGGYGKLLKGDGKGNFTAVPFAESGIFLKYDTKDLAKVETSKGTVILVANNQDSLRALLHVKNKYLANNPTN